MNITYIYYVYLSYLSIRWISSQSVLKKTFLHPKFLPSLTIIQILSYQSCILFVFWPQCFSTGHVYMQRTLRHCKGLLKTTLVISCSPSTMSSGSQPKRTHPSLTNIILYCNQSNFQHSRFYFKLSSTTNSPADGRLLLQYLIYILIAKTYHSVRKIIKRTAKVHITVK